MDDLTEYIYLTNPESTDNLKNAVESEQPQKTVQFIYSSVQVQPNQNKSKCDQPELLNLLTNWGVPILYDKCIEEEIDLDIMKNMTSRHAELLTKDFKLGVLVKFESNLKKWQMNVNSTICSTITEHAIADMCLHSEKTSTPSQSSQDIVENTDQLFKLEELLQQSSQGKFLIEKYKKGDDLNDGCRTILLELVVNYLIQKDMKMSVSLAEMISEEIVAVFPKEIKTLYFYKEVGKAPKGKLYSKYFNQLRSLKNCGLLGKRTYAHANAEIPNRFLHADLDFLEPEDDISERLQILKVDNCSWPEIENHYTATSKYRLLHISKASSTEEILNNWKHYKSPLGFKLIDIDFKVLHSGSESFVENFIKYTDKLLQIFQQKIKDHSSLSLIKEWRNIENPTENSRYATMLYLLHAVLVPTSKVVKVENGKKIHIKHSIKDSQNAFILIGRTVEEAEIALHHKLEKKEAIQPLVILTGSILHPEQILVYFDGIKFKFFSILTAIDICFKIFIVFNLEYPIASKLTWSFIQTFFYSLHIKHDKVHPNVSFLCSLLKEQN